MLTYHILTSFFSYQVLYALLLLLQPLPQGQVLAVQADHALVRLLAWWHGGMVHACACACAARIAWRLNLNLNLNLNLDLDWDSDLNLDWDWDWDLKGGSSTRVVHVP